MTRAQYLVLLVEDSPEDTEVTLRALRRAGLSHPVRHCSGGDEVLDYLYRRGRYGSAFTDRRPNLILLDLNLPGTDGREVLAEIKGDARLCSIPVVVLTTSTDERDIESCYRAGANSYLRKPVDLDGFMAAMRCLVEYWFSATILPNGE